MADPAPHEPRQYNVHEAKTQLSRILERVENGEEIVIARAGRPIARLVSERPKPPLMIGALKGKIWIADDFDDPLPDDIQRVFEGDGPLFPGDR